MATNIATGHGGALSHGCASNPDADAIRWCKLVFAPGYEAEEEHAAPLIWQRRLDVCKGTYSVETVDNSREQECPLVKLVRCSWPHHLQHNSEQQQSTLQRTISRLARTASEGSTAAGSVADAGGSADWEWMGPAASCAWDVINIFSLEPLLVRVR